MTCTFLNNHDLENDSFLEEYHWDTIHQSMIVRTYSEVLEDQRVCLLVWNRVQIMFLVFYVCVQSIIQNNVEAYDAWFFHRKMSIFLALVFLINAHICIAKDMFQKRLIA